MDWSRDGRFILYEEEAGPGSKRSLWILPVAPGDAEPRRYLNTAFNEGLGQFSPDTRWVAFQSDESGRYEIYIDTFPLPHGKVRISTTGGILPEWGADGRELFYVSADSMLVSVSLKPGTRSLRGTLQRCPLEQCRWLHHAEGHARRPSAGVSDSSAAGGVKKGLISPSSVVADTSKRYAVDRWFRWVSGQRSGRSASYCIPSPMLYTEPYGSV
jgi:hypothetical protein